MDFRKGKSWETGGAKHPTKRLKEKPHKSDCNPKVGKKILGH